MPILTEKGGSLMPLMYLGARFVQRWRHSIWLRWNVRGDRAPAIGDGTPLASDRSFLVPQLLPPLLAAALFHCS